MSQAKEWYRLWCIHMSFCKPHIVVERQPFRPYSQRKASRWNGERFIKSCVSFERWKRFTQSFPVDGRLPASFWQQRVPKKPVGYRSGKCRTCLSPAPNPRRWQLFVSCNAWPATSQEHLRVPKNYALTWWSISEVIQPPQMELISVNLSIWGHGTFICEEWLWKVNGVTGLLNGSSSTCSKSRWR